MGIFRLQQPAIQLEEGATEQGANGKTDDVDRVIPPPDRHDIIKLGLIAAGLSLAASLPLNFAPKWPL